MFFACLVYAVSLVSQPPRRNPDHVQDATLATRPPEALKPTTIPERLIGAIGDGDGRFRFVVTIRASTSGVPTGTLEVVEQGGVVPLSEISMDGDDLAFSVNELGVYRGCWSPAVSGWSGQWVQDGEAVDLVLAAPRRPQTPMAPFPYRVRKDQWRNEASGLMLAGTLTTPAGPGPWPAMVLITGTGAQDRDETISEHKPFAVLADALTRSGVAVLRVDDRGVGGSGGSVADATTLDFVGDVAASVAWLRSQPGIDGSRIGLLGHSEGGLIAPLVAAADPRIGWIVMMAGPGLRGDAVLLSQTEARAAAVGTPAGQLAGNLALRRDVYAILRTETDPQARRLALRARLEADGEKGRALEAGVNEADRAWLRTFIDLDPAPVLAGLGRPVLAVFGERDMQIVATENAPAVQAALAGNPRAMVRVLPGLNHLLQPAIDGTSEDFLFVEQTITPEALALIVDWSKSQAGMADR
jgi:uncharacterized protein